MRLIINDGITRRDPVLFYGLLDRFLLDQKQTDEDLEQAILSGMHDLEITDTEVASALHCGYETG